MAVSFKNNMMENSANAAAVVSGPRSSCLKRSKSICAGNNGVTFAPNKKACLSASLARRSSATIAALYSSSSSSEDDNDSSDENGYLNNQRRARKRAHSLKQRSASFVDNRLSHAVSKYSDEDEEEDDEEKRKDEQQNSNDVAALNAVHTAANLAKELHSEKDSKSRRASLSNSSLVFSDSKNSSKKSSLDQDLIARNRCFDYLVGSIDEAWARYCDATSYAEDEAYNGNYNSNLPNTPASLGVSEGEDDYFDDEEGYKSASTNITEYDSEFENRKISGQPSSVRLQQLKDRLLKAKYYLQDYLDSIDSEEAIAFWKRWDLVKYETIELVEDDDDDEVIEATVEDLEKGRLYRCS